MNPKSRTCRSNQIRNITDMETNLSIGDRVVYGYHEGTVTSLGCPHCSTIVITDDSGKSFTPGTPELVKKVTKKAKKS